MGAGHVGDLRPIILKFLETVGPEGPAAGVEWITVQRLVAQILETADDGVAADSLVALNAFVRHRPTLKGSLSEADPAACRAYVLATIGLNNPPDRATPPPPPPPQPGA